MGENKFKIAIRRMIDGYYFNKRYSKSSYLVLLIVCILLGMLTLGSEFGYYHDCYSWEPIDTCSNSFLFSTIPIIQENRHFVYILPGFLYSIFLLAILPKDKLLNSSLILYVLLVFMYCIAFVFGQMFSLPNFITGGVFASLIHLIMEKRFTKIKGWSLGNIGLLSGLLGTILVFVLPRMGLCKIPYVYAYFPWQIAIGLFLIFNYEEESHKIIQIP